MLLSCEQPGESEDSSCLGIHLSRNRRYRNSNGLMPVGDYLLGRWRRNGGEDHGSWKGHALEPSTRMRTGKHGPTLFLGNLLSFL